MDYQQFLVKIAQIKEMKFVPSHRVGDTGIGKTLEDLLGITENNISSADLGKYEIKAARKNTSSMLTLFTKAPQPSSANSELLEKCGYPTRKTSGNFSLRNYSQNTLTAHQTFNLRGEDLPGEKELHSTVDAISTNPQGLKLGIRDNRLYIDNPKKVLAYYDNIALKECFEKKYNSLLYVLAEHYGTRAKEYFWFNEAYLLDGFSFERFSELILEGKLKVDIRIGHYSNGKLHDHGTGFRIMPKYLPQCFRTRNKIL